MKPRALLIRKLWVIPRNGKLKSFLPSGSSSAVERQLPKLDVAGSIPVSRSSFLQTFGRVLCVKFPIEPTDG